MKAHKRLMQSLATVEQKATSPAPRPRLDRLHVSALAAAILLSSDSTLFEPLDVAPAVAPRRKAKQQVGDLKFEGTQVKRWDGEAWVNHRLPGMHRRNGKWVRR